MPYNISFISLGCAKNQVNCEQMMASVQAAGHTIQAQPEGADVVVVNTCGFLQSACEEAIDNILEMAELKRAGQVTEDPGHRLHDPAVQAGRSERAAGGGRHPGHRQLRGHRAPPLTR